MSAATDATDQATLAVIGRNPGCKRRSAFVTRAAVDRLIRAGLVAAPSTNGKLYLTAAGRDALTSPDPGGAYDRGYRDQAEWLAGTSLELARIALSSRERTLSDVPYNRGGTQATADYVAAREEAV